MRLSNGEALLHWPLEQHLITTGWTYNSGKAHNAIDLRAAVGTPVYAAEDGVVDWVQVWDGRTKTGMMSYGNALRVLHSPWNGGTLQTRYAHLSRFSVAKGQSVREGELLGYSGTSGNVYGAHLHFEVIYKGTRVHPLNWLNGDFTCKDGAVAAHLGRYTSVAMPAQDKPAAADKQPDAPAEADKPTSSQAGNAQSAGAAPADKTPARQAKSRPVSGAQAEPPDNAPAANAGGEVNAAPTPDAAENTAPAPAGLARLRFCPENAEQGAAIARMLTTLKIPFECEASPGDAMTLNDLARCLACDVQVR